MARTLVDRIDGFAERRDFVNGTVTLVPEPTVESFAREVAGDFLDSETEPSRIAWMLQNPTDEIERQAVPLVVTYLWADPRGRAMIESLMQYEKDEDIWPDSGIGSLAEPMQTNCLSLMGTTED